MERKLEYYFIFKKINFNKKKMILILCMKKNFKNQVLLLIMILINKLTIKIYYRLNILKLKNY